MGNMLIFRFDSDLKKRKKVEKSCHCVTVWVVQMTLKKINFNRIRYCLDCSSKLMRNARAFPS